MSRKPLPGLSIDALSDWNAISTTVVTHIQKLQATANHNRQDIGQSVSRHIARYTSAAIRAITKADRIIAKQVERNLDSTGSKREGGEGFDGKPSIGS